MAKIRRVIRKTQSAHQSGIENLFWPVMVALFVLGGFLLGVVLAYLPQNPLLGLCIPLILAGITAVTLLLYFLKSRVVRRSLQLAIIISVFAHVLFIMIAMFLVILRSPPPIIVDVAELLKNKEIPTVPEYIRPPVESREVPEYEQIVETTTPEPDPDQLEKQETEPEQSPERPQPVPLPEPEKTLEPNVVRRTETAESTPRQNDQMSQLSRQTNAAQANTGQTADVPQVADASQTQPSQVESKTTPVRQQTTAQEVPRRNVDQPPTTVTEHTQIEISKQQPQQNPTPQSTSSPTFERQIADARLVPRTAVVSPNVPSVPQQTNEQAQPNNTTADKQQTASPQVERAVSQPTLETPTTVEAQPQRRQERAETQPTVAQTPESVPNRAERRTERPNVNNVAVDIITPSIAPQPSPQQPTPVETQTSPVRRETATPQVSRTTPENVPVTVPSTVAATTPRRESQPTPAVNPDTSPSPTVARQATQQPSSPSVTTQVADAAAVAPAPSNQPAVTGAQASQTLASKQSSSQASVSDPSATPAPTQPTTSPSSPAAQAATRQPRAESAPTLAQAPHSVNNRRTSTEALPSATTTTAEVAVSQAPTQSPDASPRPTSAAVTRQPTSTPGATVSQPALDTPAASPTTEIARSTGQRAESATAPSLVTHTQTPASPSRSVNPAPSPASPTAVASPAVAAVERGASNPTAQPARTALSKSYSGTAGVGKSENLDRGTAAPTSPSMVASDSANRARATQTTSGPSLAPSEVAQVSRSVAGAQLPTATLNATTVDTPTDAGAQQVAEVNASSSAGLTEKGSNAEAGQVSAAKGNIDIDLGPTRIVAGEAGGRASGGGQQRLNFETEGTQLARSEVGGAPQAALATTNVAETPLAPSDAGGSQLSAPDIDAKATATTRSQAGGQQPTSGGPSAAVAQGPSAEISTAEQLASAALSRAESAEAVPGATTAGGGDPTLDDEEEEKRRRMLARTTSSGGPSLPFSTPTVADVPSSPAGEAGGGQPASLETAPDAAQLARAQSGGGSPASGEPTATLAEGPPVNIGGGEISGKVAVGRAEHVEAAPGSPVVGGGTTAPSRTLSGGPSFAANVRADTVLVAGGPSSGDPSVDPVAAQGVDVTREAGGATGPAISGPIGAVRGDLIVAAVGGTLTGVAVEQRQSSPGTEDGPALASVSNAGAPLRRSNTVGLPTGLAADGVAGMPDAGESSPSDPASGGLASAADVGPISRQASGGLVVNVAAVEGPGGLGTQVASNVGINDYRARRESLEIKPTVDSRFARADAGGQLNISTAAVVPSEGFQNRRPIGDGSGRPTGAVSPQTEAAIELGLMFLQRHQQPDGSWSLNYLGPATTPREQPAMHSDTAATGLALLAFQGAGYTHKEHKYAETVNAAIQWLLKNQNDDGDLYLKIDEDSHAAVWLYSHSIATLALCEAYGMTQDPQLREPAQKAIDFIVAAQNKERGGWRYSPGRGSDTSVTGFMFMALHSGQLANLEVPQETTQRAVMWLNRAQASPAERHLYCYNPDAPLNNAEQRHGREPSRTMTSVGLLMRLYTGWKRDNPNMVKGAQYLEKNLPLMDTTTNRDTYFWYYATQVMCHMGGDYWKAWNERLHPMLVDTQLKRGPLAGSWDPLGPVPDRWGPNAGRLYVTALNLLSLEVQYRLLPLYEDTVK